MTMPITCRSAAHGDNPINPEQAMTDNTPYASVSAAMRDGVADASVELSSRRTGMSFQRTRMSTDRTLMSVMRTSISLISFGFTISQFFSHLREANILAAGSKAPRNFGIALVALGIAMLAFGIVYHLRYMRALRDERNDMVRAGLIHGSSPYPVSLTLIVANLMLMLGLLAISSMIFNIGPF
jgi:putative membrane protein